MQSMKFKFAVAIFAAILSLNAAAREVVPVVNHEGIAVVTNNTKALSAEQVKQAIQVACLAKGWTVSPESDGKLLATLSVRNKHTIAVQIGYSADKFSLIYKNSSNMKFSQEQGQAMIHPFYNKWVQGLLDAIRLELLKA
jgi:hypothetical protein